MQFTTPDMREITISDKSEACDFIKDSCKNVIGNMNVLGKTQHFVII